MANTEITPEKENFYKKIDNPLKNAEKIILDIATEMGMDVITILQKKKEILDDKVSYFPVRHHSPSAAFHLQQFLAKKKPKIIFLEGPSDCQDLIEFMVDSDTKPPVSLFTYFKDDKNEMGLNGIRTLDIKIPMKFKAWYPFVNYSPEYVVMKFGADNKIPVYFIDSPYLNILNYTQQLIQKQNIQGDDDLVQKISNEKIFSESDFFQVFCEVFNVADLDEAWDILFEVQARNRDPERFREILLLYCIAIRESVPQANLDADATLFREQYMKAMMEKIRTEKYPKVKDEEVVVVTGGMHSAALHFTQPLDLTTLKSFDMNNSIIPFAYDRISKLSGYGAGTTAPNFYDEVWPLLNDPKIPEPFSQATLNIIIDIIDKGREQGLHLSVADTISIFQNAQLLAYLRMRDEPNNKDLRDAVITCCIKGNPENEGKPLQKIITTQLIGYKLGKVTKKFKRVGIQQDYYNQLENFGLKVEDKPQEVHLNLRDKKERIQSDFFWRLHSLDVHAVENQMGIDLKSRNNDVFREHWNLIWDPELDSRLIEKSIYGSTVEEAAINLLKEKLLENQKDISKSADYLYLSLNMGLSIIFESIYDVYIQVLKVDKDIYHLIDAFRTLFYIEEAISARGAEFEKSVHILIMQTYFAICSAIPQFSAPPPDKEDNLVKDLKEFTRLLLTTIEIEFDFETLENAVNTANIYCSNFRIKGIYSSMKYMTNVEDSHTITEEIRQISQANPDIQIQLGDFVRGLIEGCEGKILFESDILEILFRIIEGYDWKSFIAILPSLRNAFSSISPRDYSNITEKVAINYNLKSTRELAKVEAKEKLVSAIELIDQKVGKIMEDWL